MNFQPTRIVEAARELLKLCGYHVDHLWHIDDVHFICEQLALPALSDDEAMAVFAIAGERFDGETGLSWPKLEEAVRVFLKRRQLLSALPDLLAAE